MGSVGTPNLRQALTERLAVETDSTVKEAINMALDL